MRPVLVATALCLFGTSVTIGQAQEVQTSYSDLDMPSSQNGSTQSFLSHRGLLGKRYLSADYGRIDYGTLGTAEKFVFNGVDLMANLPIPLTTNNSSPVGVDVFAGFSRYKLGGIDEIESTLGAFEIGSSIYFNLDRVRPFAQVGVSFLDMEVKTTSLSQNLALVDDDVEMLLKVGAEIDLCSRAGLRTWLDINSKMYEQMGLHSDLYFWPVERVFLRAGVGIGLKSDDGRSLNLGGGFTF